MRQIEHDIRNWTRWALGRSSRWLVLCQSAESAYRSPQRDHWPEDAPPGRGETVDVTRAIVVETHWSRLPRIPRSLLAWHYIYRLRSDTICRRLSRLTQLTISDYSTHLFSAQDQLAQELYKTQSEKPGY